MWITPGLLGLMPMVLLVFANPNPNRAVEKQSLISNTALKELFKAFITQNRAVITQNRILTAVLNSTANVQMV